MVYIFNSSTQREEAGGVSEASLVYIEISRTARYRNPDSKISFFGVAITKYPRLDTL